VLTLLEREIDDSAHRRNTVLVKRVAKLRERVVGKARATGTFGVEGVAFSDGATLILRGDVDVIALQPRSLTVDLTSTTTIRFDALIAIARRAPQVDSLAVRLPAACSTLATWLLDEVDDAEDVEEATRRSRRASS
jgi:hypothetical protein